MRCYGLRAALLLAVLCIAPLALAALWLGLVGVTAVSALLVALGWISYFQSERSVLSAVGARAVSEVEKPELYRIVRELAAAARLPMPRLFISPSPQANILTVGYSARSAAVCCTSGLLRVLSPAELRAVLAHELAHVARRDVALSSWSAGFAALVTVCPVTVLLLQLAASPRREYCADTYGAMLAGNPLALASALRKIDSANAGLPLRRGRPLSATSHLMIAYPFAFTSGGAASRLLSTHPPTGERVRRLEALASEPPVRFS